MAFFIVFFHIYSVYTHNRCKDTTQQTHNQITTKKLSIKKPFKLV
jgi:hypothetical protein